MHCKQEVSVQPSATCAGSSADVEAAPDIGCRGCAAAKNSFHFCGSCSLHLRLVRQHCAAPAKQDGARFLRTTAELGPYFTPLLYT